MGKMDPALQGADHVRQIVGAAGAKGAGTEGHTVMGIIHHVHDPEHVFFIGHDPRQPEHAPGRIVWMNGHPDVIFPAYGHDLLQKIPEIFKQPFLIHAPVHGKQLLYPGPCAPAPSPAGPCRSYPPAMEENMVSGSSRSTASWV